MMAPSAPLRRVEWLVPPLVTVAAVALLLLAARSYERLPIHAPACGFKTTFGIPCTGCGGTRAMKALASGKVAEATLLNPAVVLGVVAVSVWLLIALYRFWTGAPLLNVPQQNRRIKRVALVGFAVLMLNWIYLLFFLP